MKAARFVGLSLLASLTAAPASAVDVGWVGDVDNDAANPLNWVGDVAAPSSLDRAVLRSGDNATIDVGVSGANWGQIFFNSAGTTTLEGTGTVNLAAVAGTLAIQSAGGPLTSFVNAPVSTAGTIQGNGEHDLVFGGAVSAGKFESFGGGSLTFNGAATHTGTGGFVTVNETGRVNFAGGFTTTFAGEFGLNGDGGAVYFSKYNTTGQTINLHSGKTIGSLADNAFAEAADIWARSNSTFDLNGFNDQNEFLGTNAGLTLTIDFGGLDDANSLNWQASHNMNGLYDVVNFEIGLDSLQLGAAGAQFFTDAQLAQITINGIGYSATPVATPYWDRDVNRFVQFHNIPEPASALALVSAGLLLIAKRRQK